jgi:hypothetical protein
VKRSRCFWGSGMESGVLNVVGKSASWPQRPFDLLFMSSREDLA